ncbi:MAG: Quinohemoprotein alcohol dehydrogenase precursor [Pseudomonadota bacterium]|jgi:PQQ-dependent dehydrogenase (methanol/ethanol family)
MKVHSLAVGLATVLALGASSFSTPVAAADPAKSRSADPTQWKTHGRDDWEQRYSPLKQVNADNVGTLGLAWFADLAERGGYQTTPIMVDGRIFVTTPWSKVYAFDAKTGKPLWKYDPKVPRELAATSLCCNISNRGVGYWNGKIIWGTLDGRLVAVDAKKGTKVWESQTTDPQLALSITGAPRIGNGKVFIGQAGSEFHQRGYMSAWDADTGKKLWHWWAVPGNPAKGFEQPELEWAAKTWSGDWWKTGGGGTPWDGILYDPVTDLVIFGTGNGAPWPAEVRSPGSGDNLFTSSIVAVEARTGKYKWHYQAVPADSFDFDNTSPLTVADLVIEGKNRHVVMQAPKNGVFYVIDAASGQVISANLFVPFANWLTGFDKANNWKPILNPDANIGQTGKGWYIVPFQTHVWNPQSFNPETGLMYVPTRFATFGMVSEAGAKMGNQLLSINIAKRPEAAAPKLEGGGMYLLAWDPVKQKEAWKNREGSGGSGTMTTAGNLVFQGTGQRNFSAFRADTGEKLWTTDAQASIVAGSISYQAGGKQFVAVVGGQGGPGGGGGARLLVYALDGKVTLPPTAPPVQPVLNPPANFGTDAQLARGLDLYTQNCTICHESGARMGSFPDLRYSAMLQNNEVFKAIVIDGALRENGMVSFAKVLKPEDAESIRAHLVRVANDLKANPRPAGGGFGPPGGGGPGGPGGAAPQAPQQQQSGAGLHQ